MMYKLTVDKNIDNAREWCKEHFGEIPLKKVPHNWKCGKQFAYDDKKARWIHRYANKGIFRFKDEIDAMAFKLKWWG